MTPEFYAKWVDYNPEIVGKYKFTARERGYLDKLRKLYSNVRYGLTPAIKKRRLL